MALETTPPADAATWRRHLALLLPLIEAGCRRGLAPRTVSVCSETVRELVAAADPAVMSETAFVEQCRRTGDVAVFAALVWEARGRLTWLRAAGEDVAPEDRRLRRALVAPVVGEPAGGASFS